MRHRIVILLAAGWTATAATAHAQTYSATADLFFYGDNTEFANPFRTGDTTFGVSGRVMLDAAINDTVTVRAGLFGLGRFGAHEFLEHAEPAIALQLSGGSSRFIFGSLETAATRHDAAGPDTETPHALLPPVQQETLTFTRGQEMGLQWLVNASRLEHDAWINWQRLNTDRHRERFDAGYRGDVRLTDALHLIGQWHIVHEGGQRFDSGAVSDSQAAAAGLQWSQPPSTSTTFAVDAHGVLTRHVPNREVLAERETGAGIFTRGVVRRGAWRGHLIVWRGRDTLKDEGDPNYLSLQRNGRRFRGTRDYAELGLTRHFRPAPQVHMFAAVRLHRIESQYEYSYRIVARVHLRHTF
jgi:hypothetical protein